jgi:hypothetical protein
MPTHIESDPPPNEAKRQESSSFLKKEPKSSYSASRATARIGHVNQVTKVFCFFFSKKKYFLASPVCQSLRGLVL